MNQTTIHLDQLIKKSQEFVRDSIVPILAAEPRLRVTPDQYAHAVKFLGKKRITREEMMPVIRRVLAASQEITLYAHIPVCDYHCTFCHYPVVINGRAEDAASYRGLVTRESETFRKLIPEVEGKVVTSLYVGGGTPTLMSNDEMQKLVDYFRQVYRLSPRCEVTTEGTPETFTGDKIDGLLEAGINRISVGIQVLDDDLLAQCGRRHTAKQAISAIERLVAARFEKVNVDLIYGLPGQSIAKFAADVHMIGQLKPTSVTIYRLRLQRNDELSNTGMWKLYQDKPSLFPQPEIAYGMQVVARRILEGFGYKEGPSGWFSQPGSKAQVYEDRWSRQIPLVAFGWWTYSYSREYEYRNCEKRGEYLKKVLSGDISTQTCTLFDNHEKLRRHSAFQMKSSFTLECDLASLVPLDPLFMFGLIHKQGRELQLSDSGKVLLEEIISGFIWPE